MVFCIKVIKILIDFTKMSLAQLGTSKAKHHLGRNDISQIISQHIEPIYIIKVYERLIKPKAYIPTLTMLSIFL